MNIKDKLNKLSDFKNFDVKKKILITGIPVLLLAVIFFLLTSSPKSPISPIRFFTTGDLSPTPAQPYTLNPLPYTLIYGV